MDISIKTVIPFPLHNVYEAMRDHMPEMADFMPNVKAIEVQSREKTADAVHLVNRWTPNATEIPAVARPFVDPNKTYWMDYATWKTNEKSCDWRLQMGFMAERVDCKGTTTFQTIDENNTEMIIKGTLQLNLKGLVPRLFLNKATKGVEKFVAKLVQPNFEKTASALTQYLETQKSASP